MSERKKESGGSSGANVSLRDHFLVVIAALCSFGGPYLVYLLSSPHHVKLNLTVSVIAGFVLFFIGLALFGLLIKKKVLS